MSTPTIVVLVLVVPVTVLAFALLGVLVTRRARRAFDEATRSYERLAPYLAQLERDSEVSRRELARLEDSLAQLSEQRRDRRRRDG